MDFNWKSIVGTVAPALATALGGPLAGMATAAIAKACGLGDGASQEDVMAAVQNMTPEQLAALKQAEFEFKARMKELDVDLVRIAAADRDSARQREVYAKDSWTPRILAALFIGSTIFLEGWVLLQGYPGTIPGEIVGRILGTMDTASTLILSYYFGSSAGRDTTSMPGVTSTAESK